MSIHQLNINTERLQNNLEELSKVGKLGETGVQRLALSKEYRTGIDLVKKWMDEAGLITRIDNFGNLIGRLEGKRANAPSLMIGSHIDSQPNGGRFDGPIGVLGGLEVIQTMQDLNITPEIPIEIISFCDEEGYRFNTGLFGSKGIIGEWTPEELEQSDEEGITRKEALIEFGSNPDELSESEYPKNAIASYLEMHIEQGPVLETANTPIGIVTGIAGPLWLTVEITGFAGHSGTVPMHLRKDALVGAAKIITYLNNMVQQEDDAPTVATVGQLSIQPNARAVIPEKVIFAVDLRDIDITRRNEYEKKLRNYIEEICENNNLKHKIIEDTNISPKFCDPTILEIMREESKDIGIANIPELMSGAFHDALTMAEVSDIGMIFVQSKDGISHNPEEFSKIEHIATGTELLFRTAVKISNKEDENL